MIDDRVRQVAALEPELDDAAAAAAERAVELAPHLDGQRHAPLLGQPRHAAPEEAEGVAALGAVREPLAPLLQPVLRGHEHAEAHHGFGVATAAPGAPPPTRPPSAPIAYYSLYVGIVQPLGKSRGETLA